MCARAVRTLTGSLTSRALARAELLLGTRALHGRLLSTSLSSLSGLSRLFVRCDAVMLKRAALTLLVHTRHTDNIDYYRQDVKKTNKKKTDAWVDVTHVFFFVSTVYFYLPKLLTDSCRLHWSLPDCLFYLLWVSHVVSCLVLVSGCCRGKWSPAERLRLAPGTNTELWHVNCNLSAW